MTAPFTIAQLTDLHLGPIAGFELRYWGPKRAIGYVNWLRNRRDAYDEAVLARLVADMHAQQPDHIAVTGDLVNIGLPQEHRAALAWLHRLGAADFVTVIPGNHDIYARTGSRAPLRLWAPYMTANAGGEAYAASGDGFPFLRVLGQVALVAVNSAVPTPPAMAWGRVGRSQLKRLEQILMRLGRDGLFRLVLIHHPPLPGQAGVVRGLRDAQAVETVLVQTGAELVIHGHNHRNMLAWRSWAGGRILVVGAPSASLGRRHPHEPLARYNLYRIAGPAPWTVELIGRGLAEPGGPIVEIERRKFALRDEQK
jgi:3',5'-cyclic AMP phosphodiesterase CpdA